MLGFTATTLSVTLLDTWMLVHLLKQFKADFGLSVTAYCKLDTVANMVNIAAIAPCTSTIPCSWVVHCHTKANRRAGMSMTDTFHAAQH